MITEKILRKRILKDVSRLYKLRNRCGKFIPGESLVSYAGRIYDSKEMASLVDAYGPRAVVALSVYGIGLETAARLLKYIRSDYKMFFVDVIDAQRNFIKNRKFWKID